jgi:deoxycytidine triphosphate deaminase
MLLSYTELLELVESGVVNADPANVNASSIDITLGDTLLLERTIFAPWDDVPDELIVDPAKKGDADKAYYSLNMPPEGYVMRPGEFLLAPSREVFNLPNNISCEYKLKSGLARSALDHLNAGWCDAGWNGSVLTLEFKNEFQYHHILLKPGMKCGQMVFFRHTEVPADRSYAARGQYNGDKSVAATKEVR